MSNICGQQGIWKSMKVRRTAMCSNHEHFILTAILFAVVVQISDASAQTKITIGYAAVSPRTAPLYLAQDQGLFAKNGLDPRISLLPPAATLVATPRSGEMTVGYTG